MMRGKELTEYLMHPYVFPLLYCDPTKSILSFLLKILSWA